MQNKANFRKGKMNLNFYLTKDYENKRRRGFRKNKANSKPIFKSEDRRQKSEDRRW
jgi:hypothetical protein